MTTDRRTVWLIEVKVEKQPWKISSYAQVLSCESKAKEQAERLSEQAPVCKYRAVQYVPKVRRA